MTQPVSRRSLLQGLLACSALSPGVRAEDAPSPLRTFNPHSQSWRNFEVITTVQLRNPPAEATVWVPIPSVNGHWQRSLSSEMTGNAAQMTIETDATSGAHFVAARFTGDALSTPVLKVTSRVQTRDRAVDWRNARLSGSNRRGAREDGSSSDFESAANLKRWVEPTRFITTDGIVRDTASQITKGARSDVEKTHRIYDWIIVNTYREPNVRGCGLGDIKTLLETGNLGGKCADLNGLFVGLCRAAGIPARDLYGLRLAPSAFGYKELGSNPASLKGAQHCRAEVHLAQYGWVAMDPADVDKVMRQETREWIKDAGHPLVTPVRQGLFGSWEGNWMAYNSAADVTLPGATRRALPFLMYPQAQSGETHYDPYDPDNFTYSIVAHEIHTA
jgi:transglutaminase-like putative cysteine protease